MEHNQKMMAFLAGILLKVATDQEVTENEIQSLENIAGELGFDSLDESEFRY